MDGENLRNESQALKLLSETLNRCADDFESVWREQQSAEIHAHLAQAMQVQPRMLQIPSAEFPRRSGQYLQPAAQACLGTAVIEALLNEADGFRVSCVDL